MYGSRPPCRRCGREVPPNSLICMYCGQSVNTMYTHVDGASLERRQKRASVATARLLVFLALFVNVITVALSLMDFALSVVCLMTGVICGIVALALLIFSFTIYTNRPEGEVSAAAGSVTKGALWVLIFSGVDFFVAINFSLFSL